MHANKSTTFAAAVFAAALLQTEAVAAKDKIDAYLEFKKPPYIIVDGQRIEVNAKTRVSAGRYKSAFDIPLGYAVKIEGGRGRDGTIVASKLQAAKNGTEFMESEVLAATNEEEKKYVAQKEVADVDEKGNKHLVGKLIDSGPDVERCRRIVDRLLPPYLDPSKVRVYVVDNKAWNAMAMANDSVYVFSGLLPDLSDDELAIVLGHELTHATHEHSRRQAKKGLIGNIAGMAALLAAQQIDSDAGKAVATGATLLTVTTVGNVYSREFEDQADRVGLRYVYEAGYDVNRAPLLWKRFAEKYGDGNKVTNFFFGDHSLAGERAKALQKEIARNYAVPEKDPPSTERIATRTP